jgi:CBS domain-containing protein
MKHGRTVLEAKRYGFIGCSATDLLRDIAETMVDNDISSLVVTTSDGSLVGIITRTDLLRAYWENDDWEDLPVSQHMSTEVITVTPQTLLRDVVPLLVQRHIHRVVVVEEDQGRTRPLAILSSADLIYHMRFKR